MNSGPSHLHTPIASIGLIVFIGLTVLFYVSVMDIEREIPLPHSSGPINANDAAKPVVKIGVISRYPPTIMYRGYQPIMDYLTSQTPYRFELLLSQDYNESLQNLITQKVSAVFLGSYLYVEARKKYGVIPILRPLNENLLPVSRSVLFVRKSSPVTSLGDLAGRRLALPSPESFSSHWLLDYELVRHGLKSNDIAETRHFSHHHTVIAQVLNGTYDAGVTREYLIKDLLNDGFRAVSYSAAIPSSPIAVAAKHDTTIIDALKAALLAVGRRRERRDSLTKDWDGEFVYGFVEAADSDYDIVRSVTERVKK